MTSIARLILSIQAVLPKTAMHSNKGGVTFCPAIASRRNPSSCLGESWFSSMYFFITRSISPAFQFVISVNSPKTSLAIFPVSSSVLSAITRAESSGMAMSLKINSQNPTASSSVVMRSLIAGAISSSFALSGDNPLSTKKG